MSTPRRVRAAAAFTCGDTADPDPAEGGKAAMASVARRWQDLDTEITQLEGALEAVVGRVAAPGYLARTGVGLKCRTRGCERFCVRKASPGLRNLSPSD